MLDAIHAKRAVLLAQRDQLVGQVNMTNGAIAICEELIKECQEREEQAKRAAAEFDWHGDAPYDPLAAKCAAAWDQRVSSTITADKLHVGALRDEPTPQPAPEMLPVVRDEPEAARRSGPCGHMHCEFPGCECNCDEL